MKDLKYLISTGNCFFLFMHL